MLSVRFTSELMLPEKPVNSLWSPMNYRLPLRVWGFLIMAVFTLGAKWPMLTSSEVPSSNLTRLAFLSSGLLYSLMLVIPDRWLRLEQIRRLKVSVLTLGLLWFAFLTVDYTRSWWLGTRDWFGIPVVLCAVGLTSLALWVYAW